MRDADEEIDRRIDEIAQALQGLRETVRRRRPVRPRRVVYAPVAEVAAAEHVDEVTRARARALLDRAEAKSRGRR